MKTDLITEAFRTEYPYSFWLMLVPAFFGMALFVWGSSRKKYSDVTMTIGFFIALLGTLFVWAGNMGFRDDADEGMLSSDIAQQLEIQNVDLSTDLYYSAGDWHVGRGPNGEFVEFALVKYEESDNKYKVVYK